MKGLKAALKAWLSGLALSIIIYVETPDWALHSYFNQILSVFQPVIFV